MPENLTDEQKEKLIEIVDTWDSVHRAVRFLSLVGKVLKWTVGLGAGLAMIWSVVHGGNPR